MELKPSVKINKLRRWFGVNGGVRQMRGLSLLFNIYMDGVLSGVESAMLVYTDDFALVVEIV